ncbi:MAG TPA: hypothetical protein VM287_03215 [Egibacteraceae bacterium]|nr:hypothetical protein [Egibacteraceae bacterium]
MTGCLVAVALLVAGALTLVAVAVAVTAELGGVGLAIALVGLAVFGALSSRRRAARREAEARRREQEQAARAQGRMQWLERYLPPLLRGPITGTSPLPRPWRMHRDVAVRACRDYAATVEGMAPGPLRDRLADQQPALEAAAEQVATLAAHAAELDRQLRALPHPARAGAQAAELRAAIERARHHLQERAAGMALAAAQAAHVAVSQSMADAEEVVDSVADLRSSVKGMATAMDELRPAVRPAERPMPG